MDGGNRSDQTLAGCFLQVEPSNLLSYFQPCSSKFASVAKELFTTFSSGELLFGKVAFQLLQPSLVEQPDVLQSFNRPLQIFFTSILMLFGFHLVRKCNHIADVKCTRSKLIPDFE